MNCSALAEEILEKIGGEQNVISLVHCATRLRFKLRDNKVARKEEIKKINGVLSVVESGGQFQVVVGSEVPYIYRELMELGKFSGESDSSQENNQSSLLSKVFEIISGGFSPLIPALAGSGMLKALLTILTEFGVLSYESGTFAVLSAAANAVFYFLPIFLGITLSMKLGANPYVGGVIGAALLEPNLTSLLDAGASTDFLGIPVILVDYSASVFPIFIAIGIYSLVDKLLKKIIHKDLQLFVVPMLALMIMVPLSVIAFGPFGTYVGTALSSGVTWLISKSSILAGMVLGGGMTFMVIFGLHWGFTPITLENLTMMGGDPIEGMAAAAVFAQIGIAFGIFLRAKNDKNLRTLAGSVSLTGILAGVTEPIVYGLILRYKRTIPLVIIAGAIGGAINGFFGVTMNAYVFHNIFSLPVYSPLPAYVISILITFGLASTLVYFFGFESKSVGQETKGETDVKVEFQPKVVQSEEIYSALTGKIKKLSEIEDEVFASGAMGKGIAVEPTIGQVVAPVDGTVTSLFPTNHAIGITSDNGTEILIHVGLDTVELKGEHFTPYIKTGDKIKLGDILLKFDMEKIKAAGYKLTTPIIITNINQYLDVIDTDLPEISTEDISLTVIK
ncbi:beta-glucoside-specific PTS transporter subunit IIABC [Bacillus chungangensis]|uniref:PTS system beta-glucosides-specific IIC component n=1 Tax=Bacillus chungangensis TaxID=587633 RepID=A0ABT9WNT7_9BACI|nr:beta-glucoside-specific PTS transporter subunit IIABC [Bacillus chungangensis]MDQ0174875.1 PTS system beta-glucosides-specific IIC component [Bacillus chungangensis]